jgi:hypothetical protein
VLVLARAAVGAVAVAEFDPCVVEVLLEFPPLNRVDLAVLVGRAQGTAAGACRPGRRPAAPPSRGADLTRRRD